ncbi:MAG: Na/Pi cotransporter family protein [Bacteroidales bacterium]|jgi:phosphate:Na+ symporter|nr:Na/Pi cotransporter family protein [Bacteroidales bacterium]NLM91821.1 Na/Pi cotransporter family protein [Bacteroidales bacterium]
MNFGFTQILTLFGSLSLFLFGMKTMSDGIQKVAGDKMRSILSAMTSNRFMGVLTGLIVTTLVQSSSASTVMVVSFVNAGLLNLSQAIGVIMGANIGTTTTAWIISLLGFKVSIAAYSLPLIAISFPLLMMSRERLNSLGETLLGFALLFMGLEFLKSSVPDLNNNPEIFEALGRLTDYGFYTTLIFLGIGTLLTIVLQSSSATMALTLVMCNNGWIGFEHGAALVLGENIGTTITANLAALMGNSQAKRAALAHTFFNLIGVIWMLIIFKSFIGQIDHFMVKFGLGSPFAISTMVPIGLSIFHTAFNIINTFLLIGLLKYFVTVVEYLLPSRGKKFERPQLEFFSSGFLQAAELSVFQAKKETIRFAELSHRMFNFIPAMIIETDKKEFEDLRERVSKYEEITDRVEVEITTFLVKISKKQLSGHAAEELRRMRLVCAEVEKIGDVCFKMSTLLAKKKEEKVYFTPAQRSELFEMFKLTNDAFEQMLENAEKGESFARQNLSRSIQLEARINAFRDAVGEEVIEDIEKGVAHVKSAFYFNKLVSSCEKIGDTLLNISEAVAGVNIE